MRSKSILVVVMTTVLLVGANLCHAVTYKITDLGNFGGFNASPRGINESGQIIAMYSLSEYGPACGIIWEDGTVTNLGTLGGNETTAYGLNDSGQVVGYSETSSGSRHGFLWEDGKMIDLGALGGDYSKAYGINNNRQITGFTHIDNPPDPRGRSRAFLWENSTMTSLGTLGGWVSYGYAINDLGQIAGYSYNSDGQVHGFLWEDGIMTDIGKILGITMDINNSGQIVGYRNDHGFLWDDGIMTDLGTLGGSRSRAKSINEAGQIVGESKTSTGEEHAFLWENDTMVDLNVLLPVNSGWNYLRVANAINNKGQIVGIGKMNGDYHPFLLTPVPAVLEVAVDIKPGSCPNPVNVKSSGVLPIAILGTVDYDVTTIDPTSIRLTGVEPLRSGYEDVATPVSDSNDCNCITEGPDGFLDLTLKFKTQRIVEAVGDVNDGDVLTLELTGVLYDETPIEGADCILIRGRHKPINPADINKDGVVDVADFAIFAKNWLQSSIVEE
ncbi:MAG: hypothetical protein ACYSWZ_02230 [Planctomycetota bacterium]|jgi:probable HAF family extracellular repeat protein